MNRFSFSTGPVSDTGLCFPMINSRSGITSTITWPLAPRILTNFFFNAKIRLSSSARILWINSPKALIRASYGFCFNLSNLPEIKYPLSCTIDLLTSFTRADFPIPGSPLTRSILHSPLHVFLNPLIRIFISFSLP